MTLERIGPYRLEDEIGAGGMGSVYRALDERTGRAVAIKRVHSDSKTLEESRKRLLREAKTVARLSHPAIVQMHDLRTVGDDCWLVMELVEGSSLQDLLHEGPLPIAEVIDVGRQIAEGLDHAHQAGTIHRDLKADNVMVTPAGGVKILDFGIAKPVVGGGETSLTRPGTLVGTCRAMSPEQAMGMRLDPRSDLFSLGTLLYEMASGDHPFLGSNPAETMTRVCIHRPPRVDRWDPDLPPDFVALVEDLLQKEPERRPATAALVAQRLEAMEAVSEEAGAPPTRARSTVGSMGEPPETQFVDDEDG